MEAVKRNIPNAHVTYRDLEADPVPHLDSRELATLGKDDVLDQFLDRPRGHASLGDDISDWVAGISIGAIDAALIAGNPPDIRIEKLRKFWEIVTTVPLCAGTARRGATRFVISWTRRFAVGAPLHGGPQGNTETRYVGEDS